MDERESTRKVVDFFDFKGQRYGWAFPSVMLTINAAARREALCGGYYGAMITSVSTAQQTAAVSALLLTELESHVVQYPESEVKGFSHLEFADLKTAHEKMTESIKRFRESRNTEGGDRTDLPT